jgi:hypothetical protein
VNIADSAQASPRRVSLSIDDSRGLKQVADLFKVSLDGLEITKWIFAAAYVFSTIGVAVGVYWENEKFEKAKQHRGWKLLIWSLAFDTLASATSITVATSSRMSHEVRSGIRGTRCSKIRHKRCYATSGMALFGPGSFGV